MNINEVKEELNKRIDDIDRCNLRLELDDGIITVKCVGVGVKGYETEVDTGGKHFSNVIDELAPKVVSLIKTCKERSP